MLCFCWSCNEWRLSDDLCLYYFEHVNSPEFFLSVAPAILNIESFCVLFFGVF